MPFYWIILEINGAAAAAAASRKMILYRRLFFYLTLVNNLCSFSRWSGKQFDAYAFFLIEKRFNCQSGSIRQSFLELKRRRILIHRNCNSLNGIFSFKKYIYIYPSACYIEFLYRNRTLLKITLLISSLSINKTRESRKGD